MTDEEWQHLYENFETTDLLSAVDAVDSLRDDLHFGSDDRRALRVFTRPDFCVPSCFAEQAPANWIDTRRMVTVIEPELRKFSIAEYYKLDQAGVLAPSERVELLNGQIIRMAPIGEKHRTIVDKLLYIFVDKPKKRYQLSIDQPIRVSRSTGLSMSARPESGIGLSFLSLRPAH